MNEAYLHTDPFPRVPFQATLQHFLQGHVFEPGEGDLVGGVGDGMHLLRDCVEILEGRSSIDHAIQDTT